MKHLYRFLLLLFCCEFNLIECMTEGKNQNQDKTWADKKGSEEKKYDENYSNLADGFRLIHTDFNVFIRKKLKGNYSYEEIVSAQGRKTTRLNEAVEEAEKYIVSRMSLQLKQAFEEAIKKNKSLDAEELSILSYAIHNHNLFGNDILKELLDSTFLKQAIHTNNIAIVEILLEIGVNVNHKDQYGDASLSWAIESNNVAIVEILLENGAEVNTANNQDDCPLFQAIIKGNLQIVRKLLKKGAWVNYKNKEGVSALLLAVHNDFLDIASLLINAGAHINYVDKHHKTALNWAAFENKFEIVELLFAAHTNVNTSDDQEITPFVNIPDDQGVTPLFWATFHNNIDMVSFLLAYGADVNASDNNGRTPLMIAVGSQEKEALKETLIRVLIANGADINVATKHGQPFITQVNPTMKTFMLEEVRKRELRSKACAIS